jgi:peptidoglycan/xylan/chitin deacetylase (PgdA/CDA1 family)
MTFALIYHDLAAPADREAVGFPGPLAARYKLDPDRFAAHLDGIRGRAVSVGVVDGDSPAPTCAITFDDGGASALLAADLLEARGWRGHFFVTTGRVGTPGFLTAEQVAELARRGHGVGSHSHSHPTYMGKLPRDEIAGEWRTSRAELTALLGTAPATASVPGGFLSRAVIEEAAAAGYRLLMTSEPTAKVSRCGDMTVMGRYTIWSTTSARQAAGYARGEPLTRARLWVEWQAKGLPKRLSPAMYQRLRRLRARNG